MTANPSELQLQVFVSPVHPIGTDGKTGATLSDFRRSGKRGGRSMNHTILSTGRNGPNRKRAIPLRDSRNLEVDGVARSPGPSR
jgi:hypothetical protein